MELEGNEGYRETKQFKVDEDTMGGQKKKEKILTKKNLMFFSKLNETANKENLEILKISKRFSSYLFDLKVDTSVEVHYTLSLYS